MAYVLRRRLQQIHAARQKSASSYYTFLLFKQNHTVRHIRSAANNPSIDAQLSSKSIRSSFIEYFQLKHGHEFVKSSSVIPERNSGTFFTNAGMNQFKLVFLGLAEPESVLGSYRRVVNSQKCIRVGGKHNDLQDVGTDLTHHTFFEMLGNWSFGDYFKADAINMAWDLLTNVYQIPASRLYVTYFAGDEKLSLNPDNETKELWLQLGVPSNSVIPGFSRDNFWDMGSTGPCGPCTEIHYDFVGGRDASHLVNAGNPDVVELWNLVFMQYDRLSESELEPLPNSHVDTGMGLERLSAILQGKRSNYETDLFTTIFKTMSENVLCAPYGEGTTLMQNMAYRIVADHTRMYCVSIADGILPGTVGLDGLCWKVRQIMHRCFRHQRRFLSAPVMLSSRLVDPVVDSLGGAFPELEHNCEKIKDIVMEEENFYLEQLSEAYVVMKKFLSKHPNLKHFTEIDVQELKRSSGDMEFASLDLLCDVAVDFGVKFPDNPMLNSKEVPEPDGQLSIPISQLKGLSPRLAARLLRSDIIPTQDNFKYDRTVDGGGLYTWLDCRGKVVGLIVDDQLVNSVSEKRECTVLLDKTCMYAEAGGQMNDTGVISSDQGVVAEVTSVKKYNNYVLHTCVLTEGSLEVGNDVTTSINQAQRSACARGHTATHLLNYVLKSLYGLSTIQRGSSITPDRLTFSFSCEKTLRLSDLKEISLHVNSFITNNVNVITREIPYNVTETICGVIRLPDQHYPSNVKVISAGDINQAIENGEALFPAELCGGTHVDNTGDIGAFVITSLVGSLQGVKKIVALTGASAIQSRQNMNNLLKNSESLIQDVLSNQLKLSWKDRLNYVYKVLGEQDDLPKVEREELVKRLETLRIQEKVRMVMRAETSDNLEQVIQEKIGDFPLVMSVPFKMVKEVAKILRRATLHHPVCIYNWLEGRKLVLVCYCPEEQNQQWLEDIGNTLGTPLKPVKGKNMNNLFAFVGESKITDIDQILRNRLGVEKQEQSDTIYS